MVARYTQSAESSLTNGWSKGTDMPVYRFEVGIVKGGRSVSTFFVVMLLAEYNLTTISEPHFLLQSRAPADGINILSGLGNNTDAKPALIVLEEDHHIYLSVIV